jgi:hypothetical protein
VRIIILRHVPLLLQISVSCPERVHVSLTDARFLDRWTCALRLHVSITDAHFLKRCTFPQLMHVSSPNARFFEGCTYPKPMHAFSTDAHFLQTDLLVAAAKTGKVINIKKGQFCSPAVSSSPLLRSLWILLAERSFLMLEHSEDAGISAGHRTLESPRFPLHDVMALLLSLVFERHFAYPLDISGPLGCGSMEYRGWAPRTSLTILISPSLPIVWEAFVSIGRADRPLVSTARFLSLQL